MTRDFWLAALLALACAGAYGALAWGVMPCPADIRECFDWEEWAKAALAWVVGG